MILRTAAQAIKLGAFINTVGFVYSVLMVVVGIVVACVAIYFKLYGYAVSVVVGVFSAFVLGSVVRLTGIRGMLHGFEVRENSKRNWG